MTAGLDGHWETTAPLMHSSCNDGVIQLSSLSSYAVLWGRRDQSCMFCTPCLAVFPTHFSQLHLNPANLEATVKAEWILAFLFLRKRHFSMTSQLRHHYVVWCKYWWDILQFFSHTDCQDDSWQKYEKLSKFVEVTAKILSDILQFLSRVRILTRDIDRANLSVRPSVTFQYCMKTA